MRVNTKNSVRTVFWFFYRPWNDSLRIMHKKHTQTNTKMDRGDRCLDIKVHRFLAALVQRAF